MCTGTRLIAENGAVITGRTMEFGEAVVSFSIAIVPRGTAYTGTTPGGAAGKTWTTTHGFIGFNAEGLPHLADGVNERGLGMGLFFFPGFAEYEPEDAAQNGKTLAPWELTAYLLGQCGSVAEVRAALDEVRVVGSTLDPAMGVPPMHYWIKDAAGDAIVVEPTGGKLIVHECPLGVITNSPTYDWHMVNLSNYLGLRPQNYDQVTVNGVDIKKLGQGTGLQGLPGDFTAPARFVRVLALTATAVPAADGPAAVVELFHILNQFDIPPGAVRDASGEHPMHEETQWTAVTDHTNLKYYFHTFNNRAIRMLDLNAIDFSPGPVRTMDVRDPNVIEDQSNSTRFAALGAA